ncbi:MAG TPA: NAD-dependent epimerase/dehydratase family protein [Dehalococcoidia bacterium]|nr:NAD-dependent epimerase/dehydratase family protein [Dehalococcoidia bacterium]
MLAAVTGASGHLGANLVRALIEHKWQVRALVRHDIRALEGLNIERISGDVLDDESLRRAFAGADIVFHLAGRISVVNSDRKKVEAVNITGVQNVVNACIGTNVKRLVHTSSFHAHKQEPLNEPLDESRPLLNTGTYPPYDHSKAEGERIVKSAIAKGVDTIIINPAGMVGPHDYKPSHFGATLISMAQGRLPALVNAGLNWVDNRDVAKGMISACEHAEAGAKYILSGHWVTIEYIAQQVSSITRVKPPQIILPMRVAKAIAPLAAFFDRIRGKQPLFTPISMRELESNPDISHEKASKELRYEPRPLEETIADTINWFQSYGFLT